MEKANLLLQNLKYDPVKTIYSKEITKIISYFSEISKKFQGTQRFVMKTLKLGKQNMPIPCAKDGAFHFW